MPGCRGPESISRAWHGSSQGIEVSTYRACFRIICMAVCRWLRHRMRRSTRLVETIRLSASITGATSLGPLWKQSNETAIQRRERTSHGGAAVAVCFFRKVKAQPDATKCSIRFCHYRNPFMGRSVAGAGHQCCGQIHSRGRRCRRDRRSCSSSDQGRAASTVEGDRR